MFKVKVADAIGFFVLLSSFLPFVGNGLNPTEENPFPMVFLPLVRTSAELFEMSKGTDASATYRQQEGYYIFFHEFEIHMDSSMTISHTMMEKTSSTSDFSASDDWSVSLALDGLLRHTPSTRDLDEDCWDNSNYTISSRSFLVVFVLWCYISLFFFAVKRVVGWTSKMCDWLLVKVDHDDGDDEEEADNSAATPVEVQVPFLVEIQSSQETLPDDSVDGTSLSENSDFTEATTKVSEGCAEKHDRIARNRQALSKLRARVLKLQNEIEEGSLKTRAKSLEIRASLKAPASLLDTCR